MKSVVIFVLFFLILVESQEDSKETQDEGGEPMPYNYKYIVKDEEKELYIEKEETKDENDEVKGFYTYLLPTGRIMRVEYVADKDNGFVPKFTFEDRNPFTNEKDDINEV
jgi:hypothetical protein